MQWGFCFVDFFIAAEGEAGDREGEQYPAHLKTPEFDFPGSNLTYWRGF
jgi:hypothetical protein